MSPAKLRALALRKTPSSARVFTSSAHPGALNTPSGAQESSQTSLLELEQSYGGAGGLTLPCALRVLLDTMTLLCQMQDEGDATHGEVTPEQITLDAAGKVYLLRPNQVTSISNSKARCPLHYLAPEKLRGAAFDERADVFSAGVLLWEALAGRPLLELSDPRDILARWNAGPAPLAPVRSPHVWAHSLAHIAARALSIEPEQRIPNINQLHSAVETLAGRHAAKADALVQFLERSNTRASHTAFKEGVLPFPRRLPPPDPRRLPDLSEHAIELRADDEPNVAEQDRERFARFSAVPVGEDAPTLLMASPSTTLLPPPPKALPATGLDAVSVAQQRFAPVIVLLLALVTLLTVVVSALSLRLALAIQDRPAPPVPRAASAATPSPPVPSARLEPKPVIAVAPFVSVAPVNVRPRKVPPKPQAAPTFDYGI